MSIEKKAFEQKAGHPSTGSALRQAQDDRGVGVSWHPLLVMVSSSINSG